MSYDEEKPIHLAAKSGQLEVFTFLFDNMKNQNEKHSDGKPTTGKYAIEYGFTPLHYAAESGHLEICKFILDNMEDQNGKNSDGKTPLDFATEMGHEEVCNLLKLYDLPKNLSKCRRLQ